MKNIFRTTLCLTFMFFLINSAIAEAVDLKIGDAAPLFKAKTQSGAEFDLASRKGKWTVLYFYPKAGTPGCTKQACAFRDSLDKIRALGADVFGISADTVEDQAKFYKEHHLNFDLIADPNADVVSLYGSKIPLMKVSKRWTFILDPDLKIRNLLKDVDPVADSNRVAKEISVLQKESSDNTKQK